MGRLDVDSRLLVDPCVGLTEKRDGKLATVLHLSSLDLANYYYFFRLYVYRHDTRVCMCGGPVSFFISVLLQASTQL